MSYPEKGATYKHNPKFLDDLKRVGDEALQQADATLKDTGTPPEPEHLSGDNDDEDRDLTGRPEGEDNDPDDMQKQGAVISAAQRQRDNEGSERKRGGRIGMKRADGGNVEPISFGAEKTADALSRLNAAGELKDKDRAGDFAAAKLSRMGIDPEAAIGRSAKYAKGGKVED